MSSSSLSNAATYTGGNTGKPSLMGGKKYSMRYRKYRKTCGLGKKYGKHGKHGKHGKTHRRRRSSRRKVFGMFN
jgi:hypothetical protein